MTMPAPMRMSRRGSSTGTPRLIVLHDRGKQVHPRFYFTGLHQALRHVLRRSKHLGTACFENEETASAGQDRVTVRDDDDRRTAIHGHRHRLDQLGLAFRVEERIGLVEDEQHRLAVHRAGQRDALRLAGRQTLPERSERRVVALRQLQDELMGAGRLGCLDRKRIDVLAVGAVGEAGDIFLDRAFEQARLLRQIADVAGEVVRFPVGILRTVDADRSRFGRNGACEDLCERCLARPARTDDAEHLARAHIERHIEEDRLAGRPAKSDLVEFDPAGRFRKPRVNPLGRYAGHDVGKPPKRGMRAGQGRPAADHGLDRLERAAEDDRRCDDRSGRNVTGDRQRALRDRGLRTG